MEPDPSVRVGDRSTGGTRRRCGSRFSTGAAIAAPIVAGAAWGLYNVPGDSSRSGKAAMPVPGVVRLAIELLILFGAAWALIATGHAIWGWILAGLVLFHLAFSIPRVRWLLGLWSEPVVS